MRRPRPSRFIDARRHAVLFSDDKENASSANRRGTQPDLGPKGQDMARVGHPELEADECSAFDIPLPEVLSRKQDAGRTPYRHSFPEPDVTVGLRPRSRQLTQQQLSMNNSRSVPRHSGGLGSGARRVSPEVLKIQTDLLERVYEDIDRYLAPDGGPEIELSPIADDPSPTIKLPLHRGYSDVSEDSASLCRACPMVDDSSTSSDDTRQEDWTTCVQGQDHDSRCEDSLCLEDLLGFNAPPFRIDEPEDSLPALPTEGSGRCEANNNDLPVEEPSIGNDDDVASESLKWAADDTIVTAALTTLTIMPAEDSAVKATLPPRVSIVSKARRTQDFEDVKEIVLQTEEARPTSAVLTFCNDKACDLRVQAEAVLMHCDEFSRDRHVDTEVTLTVFSVRPSSLTLGPGSEAVLHVTFNPQMAAIYSGLLKIKCNKRFFTFFLRGECIRASEDHHHHAPEEGLTCSLVKDDDISITSSAQRRNTYIHDWLSRSRSLVVSNVSSANNEAQLDSSAFSVYPSVPAFEVTSDPNTFRSTLQLRNRLKSSLTVYLRCPFLGIILEHEKLIIPSCGAIT